MTRINITRTLSSLMRSRSAVFGDLAQIYQPAIMRQREKLIQLAKENAERATKSEVARKLRVAKEYWKVEMAPPTSADEMTKLRADFALVKEIIKTGAYKYMTVSQAWLLFLVAMEIGFWFYLGETIGKFHIVGYKV